MKMSPSWGVGVFEASIAVVERDASVESVIELNFGTCDAEAPMLGQDLETVTLPLHDVVVADDAFVNEGRDTREIRWGRASSFGGVARST